jgi:hypothetical protein
MKPSTRIGADPTFCRLCGDRYWSWGAHAERCTGSRSALSERDESRIVAENHSSGGRAQKPRSGDSRTPGLSPSRSESVEPPCECPPGFQHQPDCYIVVGQKP